LDQPDFINAVAEIVTAHQPVQLLHALLKIERNHGRIRDGTNALNAPRTLDLDILLYENLRLETEALILPHPRMIQRAFVLLPLMEIAPDCEIPGHGKIGQFLAICRDQTIERLDIPK
jgi:2-amino-4-hydroxy-6-hydroxymethyldihydropteridine diphosphokinase